MDTRKHQKIHFSALIMVLLCSCDTFSGVRGEMKWKSQVIDEKCVKDSINSTKNIEFIQHSRLKDSRVEFYSNSFEYNLKSKKDSVGRIFFVDYKGKLRVYHEAYAKMNRKMEESEKDEFLIAINGINENLKKNCSDFEFIIELKKTKDSFF